MKRQYPLPQLYKAERLLELNSEIDNLVVATKRHDTFGSDGSGRCPCSSCKRFSAAIRERDSLDGI